MTYGDTRNGEVVGVTGRMSPRQTLLTLKILLQAVFGDIDKELVRGGKA